MAKAWVSQKNSEVTRVGKKKASWYANWYEPGGKRKTKSCGPGSDGKQMAFRLCKQIERDLITGDYGKDSKDTSWTGFVAKITEVILPSKSSSNARIIRESLEKFKRLVTPTDLNKITTLEIDKYIAKRLQERGSKKGSTVAPHTVNKELRTLKALFRIAHDWELLSKVPKFHFLGEPEKIPNYVPLKHFSLLYDASENMSVPKLAGIKPADWWRCVLTTCYLTGWRIGEVLQIHKSDLDFKTGILIARYQNEKRKRDDRVRVPLELLDVLSTIWESEHDYPMQWPKSRRLLYNAFHDLQQAAGICLPCHEKHEHTAACHLYGFHDLRRGFATLNARTINADELQKLMKHKSYTTTKKYINLANRLELEPSKVQIPEFLLRPSEN